MSDDSNKNDNPNIIKIRGFSLDKRIPVILFILAFILIYLTQNVLFIKQDTGIWQTDSHIFRAHKMYEVLFRGKKHDLHKCAYPPLLHIVTMPFFLTRGLSIPVARLSISVFTIIFLVAMFGIGYELGGYYSGAVVMTLGGSCPWILEYSRIYMQDFPQTAMTALAFYFLLKSRSYKNRVISIILGIVLALSLLTKWSSAFFITLPLLWFLVPVVFRSKRAFIVFLGSIIVFSIMGWGIFRFFRVVNNPGVYPHWFKNYLIFIICPSILYFVSALLLERKWKKDESYTGSGTYQIINFSFMLIICLVIFFLWFLWASQEIRAKFLVDIVESRDFGMHKQAIMELILNMYNFAPVLMALGFIFMFIFRRDLYRKLLLPVSLGMVSVIMYYMMFEGHRYILSLVIFGSALGGYWVCNTKRLKPVLTSFLVGISLVTITAHTIIPADQIVFREGIGGVKLLTSKPPDKTFYNIGPVIDHINKSEIEGEPKKVIFYRIRYVPFSIEYIRWNAIKKGKRVEPICSWEESYFNRMKMEIDEIKRSPHISVDKVEEIMVIHKPGQFPQEPVNIILELFPGIPYEKKVFDVCEGYSITLIKLERKE